MASWASLLADDGGVVAGDGRVELAARALDTVGAGVGAVAVDPGAAARGRLSVVGAAAARWDMGVGPRGGDGVGCGVDRDGREGGVDLGHHRGAVVIGAGSVEPSGSRT